MIISLKYGNYLLKAEIIVELKNILCSSIQLIIIIYKRRTCTCIDSISLHNILITNWFWLIVCLYSSTYMTHFTYFLSYPWYFLWWYNIFLSLLLFTRVTVWHLTRGLTNPYCRKTIDNGEKPFHHRVPHEKSCSFYVFFLSSCIRIFICSIVLCHSKLEQRHWFNERINTIILICQIQYALYNIYQLMLL